MFIGLDVGTSSTKGIVIDGAGVVVASHSEAHDFDRPQPGWAEQDPAVWWGATRLVLQSLTAAVGADEIKAVGLSGQMHGSVFLDQKAIEVAGGAEPRAIRPALMWNDQRTAAACEEIVDRIGGVRALVEQVGNAPLTGFTLPKILWFRAHEPEAFDALKAVCLPKDFVRLCLSGALATDVGDAAGTLLLDVEKRDWSATVVEAMDLDRSILPPVLESGAIAGRVTSWASSETGLAKGTPIVVGSGDNQCGGIGAGVVSQGRVALTLGTSGVVFAHTASCVRDLDETSPGRVHTMCSATGDGAARGAWTITGCMLSAAGSLEWARSVLAPGVAFEELMNEAARAPAGCDGLVFLPYLTGERCPYPDPVARGGWVGLTRSHTRGHLVRSVLEGVCFGLADVLELVETVVPDVAEIRLGGGGAKSNLWRQILADVLGRELVSMRVEEGPAHGAALLAAVSQGAFATIQEACDAVVQPLQCTEPGSEVNGYQTVHSEYRGLYAALSPTMHALSRA